MAKIKKVKSIDEINAVNKKLDVEIEEEMKAKKTKEKKQGLFGRIKNCFINEVTELKKVKWLHGKSLFKNFFVVLAFMIVMAIFYTGCDVIVALITKGLAILADMV